MRGIKLSIILVLVIMLSVGTMFAANITVATASDLWSLREAGNLGGNHTQTKDIDLSTPAWAANNTDEYAVGKVVSYDGYAYCCDTGHTSGDNFDAVKWTKMWEVAKGWEPIGKYTGN